MKKITNLDYKKYNKEVKKDIKKADNVFKLNFSQSKKDSKLLNLEINLQKCNWSGFFKK